MSKDKATLVAMTMTFTFLSLGSLAFTLLLLNYYPAYAQQKDIMISTKYHQLQMVFLAVMLQTECYRMVAC